MKEHFNLGPGTHRVAAIPRDDNHPMEQSIFAQFLFVLIHADEKLTEDPTSNVQGCIRARFY